MPMHPMLSALRRHKAGTLLVALQIALTLAIVCNALFIIHDRFAHMDRTTGIDENNLLLVQTAQTGVDSNRETGRLFLDASIKADLMALRHLPDVSDAYETNALPLSNASVGVGLRRAPTDTSSVPISVFYADEHALSTLGVQLVAGRGFHAEEITGHDQLGLLRPTVVIVSRQMADRLFPDGQALGRSVYFSSTDSPTIIIGIVAQLQADASGSSAENSVLIPMRLVEASHYYAVRAKPGRLVAAMQSVPATL